MRDRPFGVEIECSFPGGPYRAADTLHAAGFTDWANGDIHSDGSGTEIPSPILQGDRGLAELRAVMALLVDKGAEVTRSDGFHVHHSAPEFVNDEELQLRLVETWAANRKHISAMVSEYRRGNYWACYDEFWNERKIEEVKASLGKPVPYTYRNDTYKPKHFAERFAALNLYALDVHGTIEFRQHEGTLNFEHASAWIHFGQAFLETVKKRKTILSCADTTELLLKTQTAAGASITLLNKVSSPVDLPGSSYNDDYADSCYECGEYGDYCICCYDCGSSPSNCRSPRCETCEALTYDCFCSTSTILASTCQCEVCVEIREEHAEATNAPA